MTRRAAGAAGCAGLLALAAGLPAADPAEPAGTPADVVFFAPDGPARVRLYVLTDGRPAEAVWREAADRLFAFCDRDGDGVLDAAERAALNRLPRDPEAADDPDPAAAGKAARLDRAGFAAALRAAGLGPVRVSARPVRPDSQQLTDALFARLDRDGDGKLSPAELKAAREQLAALDADEDEFVSAEELLGRPARPADGPVRLVGRRPAPQPDPSVGDLLVLPAGTDRAVKALLAARDRDKSGTLSRQELGVTAEALAKLDQDGNGQLDPDELAAWLRRPPDVELAVSVGEGGGLADRSRRQARGPLTLAAAGAEFRFAPPDAGPDRREWGRAVDAARRQFDRLAGDKGAVERKQLEDPAEPDGIAPLFEFADRDGDGKLTRDELTAALAVLTAVAGSRAEVTFADRGRGLFERLDADGDGRLSPRELLAAAGLLPALDRDGDGLLAKGEVPRQFAVASAPAPLTPLQLPQLLTAAMPVPAAAAPPADVPAWFRRMDRNGDGDVSLREFLGPLELFRALDRDGDGLISADEARAAEKAAPRPK